MRVLGRIRLSRESNETGTSIERQREAVEQWSAMHGHDVIGWVGQSSGQSTWPMCCYPN